MFAAVKYVRCSTSPHLKRSLTVGCNTHTYANRDHSVVFYKPFVLAVHDWPCTSEGVCVGACLLTYCTQDPQRVQTISLTSFGAGLLTCLAFHLIFTHARLESLKCIHWWWPCKNGSTLFKLTRDVLCIITKLYCCLKRDTKSVGRRLTVHCSCKFTELHSLFLVMPEYIIALPLLLIASL
jgi:hypothetical protein